MHAIFNYRLFCIIFNYGPLILDLLKSLLFCAWCATLLPGLSVLVRECVYACVCVCMRVCMRVCVFVRIYVCMYIKEIYHRKCYSKQLY